MNSPETAQNQTRLTTTAKATESIPTSADPGNRPQQVIVKLIKAGSEPIGTKEEPQTQPDRLILSKDDKRRMANEVPLKRSQYGARQSGQRQGPKGKRRHY